MHPAPSIIIFTTLSGAGFGLMAWLGLGFGPDDALFALLAGVLSFTLTCSGLVASLFHLGNPQRAWRALSQWRTSWLSREGVLALATLGGGGLYILIWLAGSGRSVLLGLAVAALALASVYSTSMIYASIRAVPRWAKSPTQLLFVAFAGAGGMLALAAIAALAGAASPSLFVGSALMLLIAAGAAIHWTAKSRKIHLSADGSAPETAIGLAHLGRARLLEAPHSSPNYLMKEMVFRIGRKHAAVIHRVAVLAAFILPLSIIALAGAAPSLSPVLLLALLIHLIGVAASRWLFFAEAEHVVALYYGHR